MWSYHRVASSPPLSLLVSHSSVLLFSALFSHSTHLTRTRVLCLCSHTAVFSLPFLSLPPPAPLCVSALHMHTYISSPHICSSIYACSVSSFVLALLAHPLNAVHFSSIHTSHNLLSSLHFIVSLYRALPFSSRTSRSMRTRSAGHTGPGTVDGTSPDQSAVTAATHTPYGDGGTSVDTGK